MKKILLIFSASLVLWGCADRYADEFTSMRQELDDINKRLDELSASINSEVASLKEIVNAIQSCDYITGITSVKENGVEIGYKISFFKGEDIFIRNGEDGDDAKDGKSPVVGVRQFSDGNWYWTVDNQWLLDSSGNKVRANAYDGKDGQNGADGQDGQNGQDGQWGTTGVTPEFKIENGLWYYTVDGGRTWIEYGTATGADGAPGKDGSVAESIFKNLTWDASNVYFHLKSGAVIPVPRNALFEFTLSQFSDIMIAAGETVSLNYSIDKTSSAVLVSGMSDSGWKIDVVEDDAFAGVVKVTAPTPYEEGKVIVIASDPAGNMQMKPLTFIVK